MQVSATDLAARLGEELLTRGWYVSCAESCTGGGIAYAITSTAGSSGWFNSGYITYSNDVKQSVLGVFGDTLATFGAVSRQTVLEMASGCAKISNAELALSVSGIAGPGGGSADKPVGTVWFGFSVDGKLHSDVQVFQGDRQAVREQAIGHCLEKALLLTKNQ